MQMMSLVVNAVSARMTGKAQAPLMRVAASMSLVIIVASRSVLVRSKETKIQGSAVHATLAGMTVVVVEYHGRSGAGEPQVTGENSTLYVRDFSQCNERPCATSSTSKQTNYCSGEYRVPA
jgi:hypothetical protein